MKLDALYSKLQESYSVQWLSEEHDILSVKFCSPKHEYQIIADDDRVGIAAKKKRWFSQEEYWDEITHSHTGRERAEDLIQELYAMMIDWIDRFTRE